MDTITTIVFFKHAAMPRMDAINICMPGKGCRTMLGHQLATYEYCT
jgi:hypothetical protein